MAAAVGGVPWIPARCELLLARGPLYAKLVKRATVRRTPGLSLTVFHLERGSIQISAGMVRDTAGQDKYKQNLATESKMVDVWGDSNHVRIDPAFIVPPEFRPRRRLAGDSLDISGVPLLDLSVLRSQESAPSSKSTQGLLESEANDFELQLIRRKNKLVKEVGNACRDWGFFQVVNHGVETLLLNDVVAEMKKFFALPYEEKRKVFRTPDSPTVGYFDSELTKNVMGWKEVFDFVQGTVAMPETYNDAGVTAGECVYSNKWPQNMPSFRDMCMMWAGAMEKLSFEILGLITESLGLPTKYFHKHFGEKNTTFVRLNHYPKCPNPELVLGVNQHKDSTALTVLWQDEIGGLEIRRKDGEWISIPPHDDALIVNVGDLFQVWSNDEYMSVEHRAVVNERRDRYSIPYFFNPTHTTDIFPAPELTDAAHPPKYRPYNWGYSLKRRKNANVRSTGENLQISNFAINRSSTT